MRSSIVKSKKSNSECSMFEDEESNDVIYYPRVFRARNMQLLTNASDVEVLCGPHTEWQTWVPNPIAKTRPHAAAKSYEPEDTPFKPINRRRDRDWYLSPYPFGNLTTILQGEVDHRERSSTPYNFLYDVQGGAS